MELGVGALKRIAEAAPFIFCLGWNRRGRLLLVPQKQTLD